MIYLYIHIIDMNRLLDEWPRFNKKEKQKIMLKTKIDVHGLVVKNLIVVKYSSARYYRVGLNTAAKRSRNACFSTTALD